MVQKLYNQPMVALRTACPVLKWAGGKGALLGQFTSYFPRLGSYRRYFEPFVGGAAVFFHLQPPESYLFDLNAQLIEVYQTVRANVDELIETLKQHHNDSEYFYEVRARDPASLTAIERAARFIFLNRTCYNGLYRVNRSGQFNVPFGSYKNPTICDEIGLRVASLALQDAHLEVSDFGTVLQLAQPGDFIYFDPPYEPLSVSSSFTTYTSNGFTSEDQRRLAETYRELDRRGCLLLLSNSTAPLIYELYAGYQIHEISARRAINSKPNGRGLITELLIANFDSESSGFQMGKRTVEVYA
ncbi:MAG: DNA adenine methylase [Aggregatilineales bacterium]